MTNTGDTIDLLDDDRQVVHSVTYGVVAEGGVRHLGLTVVAPAERQSLVILGPMPDPVLPLSWISRRAHCAAWCA